MFTGTMGSGILKFVILAVTGTIISRGQGLTIDNQLVIIANDCYTRIAIGSVLPPKDVAKTATAATVSECEDQCSRKRNTCEIFSFGISSKGNATCLLGSRVPEADELIANSDYDVYIRQQSSPDCMPDRLYKLGSGQRNPTNLYEERDSYNEAKKRSNDTSRFPKPGGGTHRPSSSILNIIPGPGGFGTVTLAEIQTSRPQHHGGEDNENPGNHQGSLYQVTEGVENFAYPGTNNFDLDNPNAPYNYANKNPYGPQGSSASYGHVKPQGDRDYYLFDFQTGINRYGTNVYYEPPTSPNKNYDFRNARKQKTRMANGNF